MATIYSFSDSSSTATLSEHSIDGDTVQLEEEYPLAGRVDYFLHALIDAGFDLRLIRIRPRQPLLELAFSGNQAVLEALAASTQIDID